jgi:hypothetical protein
MFERKENSFKRNTPTIQPTGFREEVPGFVTHPEGTKMHDLDEL